MALSTRLRSKPELRVNYAALTSQTGSRGNPIVLEQSSVPEPTPTMASPSSPSRRPTRKPTSRAAPKETPKTSARVKAGAVVKPKAEVKKKSGKVAPTSKKKERPVKIECIICAESKTTARSFKVPEDAETCDHFKTTCGPCIQKYLKAKVSDRKLDEQELLCGFLKCDGKMDIALLRAAVSKTAFVE
jgi:hypothetical protein